MPQAPRIAEAEWEARKALITDLWINQNKTLDEVMDHMAGLGFFPSRPQWIRRINVNWKLRKNSTKEEWQHARSLLTKRKANGKETDLLMNGKIVPSKKRMKELKRYSTLRTDLVSHDSSHFHAVVVSTPPAFGERQVSHVNLPSFNTRDILRKFRYDGSTEKVHGRGRPHVPLQRHDTKLSLDNFEAFIIETLGMFNIPEVASSTIEMVNERFPVLDAHQNTEQARQPIWIQIFEALVLISTNGLWDDVKPSLRCLDYFVGLVLSHCRLEHLERLLIETNETNGMLATHILFSAIKAKSAESLKLMRMLLGHGVCANSTDPKPAFSSHWWTALHEAVYRDNQSSVKLLIEFGANPHPYSETTLFMPPLEMSPQHLHECWIRELPSGADSVDILNDYGHRHEVPPLFQAIRNGSLPCAQTLLDAGVDPNFFHPSLMTALHCAIDMNDLNMVNVLIKAGALPEIPLTRLREKSVARLPNATSNVQKCKTVFTHLQVAVRSKSLAIVEYLLHSGARPNMTRGMERCQNYELYFTGSAESCLQISASTGNYKMMCLLLASEVDQSFRHEDTSISLQIVCGSVSMSSLERYDAASLLLRHGADTNASPAPRGGRTSLQAAVEVGDYRLVKLLLHKGAYPNTLATLYGGVMAMEAAIKSGSEDLKRLLMRNGTLGASSDPGNGEKVKRRNLELAVCSGNVTLLKRISRLERGVDISFSNEDVKLAMKGAIVGDSLSLLRKLLSMYGPVNILWVVCETIWQGKSKILEWIMSWLPPHGFLKICSRSEPSPLWVALHQRNRGMVRRLLLAGADPNQTSRHICRPELSGTPDCPGGIERRLELPIQQAISPGHGLWEEDMDMVELLVHHGAHINPLVDESSTPLLLAVKEGKYETADFLLQKGANPNASDASKNQAAITYASLAANYRLVKSLIEHGADVRESSSWGSAIQALTHHRIDDAPDAMQRLVWICRLLLDSGADVNADPTEHCIMTALQEAIDRGTQELVEMFFEAGANIHAPAFWDGGRTALQAAASTGNFKLVKRLVEMGADVNAPPAKVGGATALQYAAISGHVNMVIFLLEHGASIKAPGPSKEGFTGLQGASEYGRLDMIHFLLENDQDPHTIEERCRECADIAEEEGFTQIAEFLRGYKRP